MSLKALYFKKKKVILFIKDKKKEAKRIALLSLSRANFIQLTLLQFFFLFFVKLCEKQRAIKAIKKIVKYL